jgi:hypothetical protein
MHPSQPIQPVVGDHRAWPSAPARPFTPFGVPLHASELLRLTFDHVRQDAARVLGVTGLPYAFIAMLGVGAVIIGAMTDDFAFHDGFGALEAALVGVGGGLCVTAGLLFLAANAGTFLLVEERLRHEDRSAGAVGALLSGLPHLLRLTVAYVVSAIVFVLPLAPALVSTFAAVASESWSLGLFSAGLWFVGGVVDIYVGLRLVAVGPVIVFENVGPLRAVTRSIELTRGRVVDVFVASIVVFGVIGAINMATSILGIVPLVGAVVQLVVGVVLAALQSVFLALLYAALRDREADAR